MTQEERPNWVEARGNCTLEGTFEQIVDSLQHDLKCFEQFQAQNVRDRTADLKRDCLEKATVCCRKCGTTPLDEDVSVRVLEHRIHVFRNRKLLFVVDREWNEQTLTCDLKIDGEVLARWLTCQRAIGDLLFG